MPEVLAGIDPNLAVAVAGFSILLMLITTVSITAFVFVRPRLRLRRRMGDLGLIAGGGSREGGGGGGNPRQKRIQDKLQELEEKKNAKKSRRNQIRGDLLQAGIDLKVRDYLMVTAIVGLVAASLAMLFGLHIVTAVAIGLVGTLGVPKMVLKLLGRSRRKKFTAEFATAVDVIVRGIKSGLPVGECLSIIGRESPEPVGEEFRLLIKGQKIGISLDELLNRGLERMAGLSEVLRERKKMNAKVQSLSSEAKASAMIIGALPFLVSAGMYGMNPDYMSLLFTTTVGNVLLGAGLTWMAIGISVMTKMINFDI